MVGTRVPLLPPMTAHFRGRHTHYSDLDQGLLDRIKSGGLHNCFELGHHIFLLVFGGCGSCARNSPNHSSSRVAPSSNIFKQGERLRALSGSFFPPRSRLTAPPLGFFFPERLDIIS